MYGRGRCTDMNCKKTVFIKQKNDCGIFAARLQGYSSFYRPIATKDCSIFPHTFSVRNKKAAGYISSFILIHVLLDPILTTLQLFVVVEV